MRRPYCRAHTRPTNKTQGLNCKKAILQTIEGFRSFFKRRLRKPDGVPAATFSLRLKGCQRRFNHRHDNLYLELLRPRQHYPL